MLNKIRRTTVILPLMISAAAGTFYAQLREVPITEGWARNQINTVIFRRNSITSFGGYQYAAFYNAESKVVFAKRKLGATNWQIRETHLSGNTADAHNSISIAVDGKGFVHLAWNNHNSRLNYTRGETARSVDLPDRGAMVGSREDRVTYPEFYNLPAGDLLFLYRDGASGSGNLVLNRYDVQSQKWTRVQDNLIDGEGRRNAYPQTAVDLRGTIHLSWVWRESPDVATNHDLCYARSTDGGKTWRRSSGEKYRLPITAATAEYVRKIPQNSELINQTSIAADASGNPFIATYWRDQNSSVPQYRVVYFDGKIWRTSQVSNRTAGFTLSGGGTKRIPISRPQVLVDSGTKRTKVIVLFRDIERGNRVSAAVCDRFPKCEWTLNDLTKGSVGMWEPTVDYALWDRTHQLHLFIQNVGQGDSESLEQMSPQMVSILEWKP